MLALATLPLLLSACAPATSGNTNVVTLDLTQPEANLNVAPVASTNASANVNTVANVNAPASGKNVNVATARAVRVTASGFVPATVTLASGGTVTWTNETNSDVRVASDPHPTHTDLPGLDSAPVPKGGSYSFTFLKVGSWGYHDHLNPTVKGTIVVQ